MKGFPLDGGTYNGGGSPASFVYIPASEIAITLHVTERNYVTLSGAMEIGTSYVGDISRVAPFGPTSVESGWVFDGSLNIFQSVSIGQGNLTLGFDLTGPMVARIQGPDGEIGIDTEFTGALTKTAFLAGYIESNTEFTGNLTLLGLLSGSFGLTNEFTGVLGATQYLTGEFDSQLALTGALSIGGVSELPAASIEMSIEHSGALRQYGMLAGVMPLSIDHAGSLTRGLRQQLPLAPLVLQNVLTGSLQSTRRMAGDWVSEFAFVGSVVNKQFLTGDVAISLDMGGFLSNNAYVDDEPALLMIRPYTLRDMQR